MSLATGERRADEDARWWVGCERVVDACGGAQSECASGLVVPLDPRIPDLTSVVNHNVIHRAST